MSLRVRILLFLAALCLDAIFVKVQPWPVLIGTAAYLVLVMPALTRKP